MTDSRRLSLSAKVFLVCGFYLVALSLYFAPHRPALLPEDPRHIGSSLEAIRAAVPGLERWLGLVLKVMGGFMVAIGALMMLAAYRWLAKRERGTFAALAVAGAASVGLMSAINFLLHSDFGWLLLLPVLLWLLGLACYFRER